VAHLLGTTAQSLLRLGVLERLARRKMRLFCSDSHVVQT